MVVKPDATLAGGAFKNEPTVKGAGTFRTVTLNGTGSITAVNGLASDDWGNTLYVVPNVVPTGANTITASEPIRDINLKAIYGDDVAKLYPNQSDLSTILLNELFIFITRMMSKYAADNDRLSGKFIRIFA